VHLADRVAGACAPGATVTASVTFDGAAVGEARFPCGPDAHTVKLAGPKVTPGLHEIVVRTEGPAGPLEAAAVVSLPAFDVTSDGKNATLGSEIVVDVGVEDLSIEPPLVYAPHDL
jgi:hypothetical protein